MAMKRHNTNTRPKFQKGPTFVVSQFLHIHSYVTSIQETSKIMRINVTFLRHWQTHLSQPGSLCMHPKCSMSRDKRRKSPVKSKRKEQTQSLKQFWWLAPCWVMVSVALERFHWPQMLAPMATFRNDSRLPRNKLGSERKTRDTGYQVTLH